MYLFSFAFLDFKSVEQATLALANRRNHFLYNRKLKIQVRMHLPSG